MALAGKGLKVKDRRRQMTDFGQKPRTGRSEPRIAALVSLELPRSTRMPKEAWIADCFVRQ